MKHVAVCLFVSDDDVGAYIYTLFDCFGCVEKMYAENKKMFAGQHNKCMQENRKNVCKKTEKLHAGKHLKNVCKRNNKMYAGIKTTIYA